jgi:DNA polymerase-3 subunit beta
VTVDRAEFINSVERALVLIRGDKNNLIVLEIKPDLIKITANSEIGNVCETVVGELNGKELKIAMNGKYLLDAIKALEEEDITLSFNSAVSPFTVENQIDKRYQYLILPVRTSNSAQ